MDKQQKLKSSVFEYFHISLDGKCYICQVTNDDNDVCGTRISAYSGGVGSSHPTRASNLKRHLQRHHPDESKIVTEKDEKASKQAQPATSSKCSEQPSISKFFKI